MNRTREGGGASGGYLVTDTKTFLNVSLHHVRDDSGFGSTKSKHICSIFPLFFTEGLHNFGDVNYVPSFTHTRLGLRQVNFLIDLT